MRYLLAALAVLIVTPVAAAQPIQGGIHQLAQGNLGADATAVYNTTISKSQAGVGSLAFEERITYAGVDVGGFSVIFTPNTGTPIKQFGVAVVRNNKTTDLLDQQIDISYGGTVIAHAEFSAVVPIPPDTIHGLSCMSWNEASGTLPMTFSCDPLPPA